MLTANVLSAQRYTTEIFTEVDVTEDVVYGENATVLFQFVEEAKLEELICDVYEPAGDEMEDRPLVLVFHSGNFLPPVINGQIIGSRKDSSVVEFCTQLAKRGFVAVSVSYRLGWNPLAATQAARATGFIQALYRGIQDGRTAIRYFKSTELEESNPFRIDSDNISCLGVGAGGYIVLGMVGLDDYSELLNTTNPATKFILDLDSDGIPETAMIDTLYAGDIEAKKLAIAPESILGFLEGDTLNYPNHPDYNSDFQLGINIGGGVGDISWLEDQTVPCISIQSINDLFTPYNDLPLIVAPFDPVVNIQGSQKIGEYQESNGINQKWKDFNFFDPITELAITNSVLADHPYYEGVFPYAQDPNSLGIHEGVVIDWWDPEAMEPSGLINMPWNMAAHPNGGTYHEVALQLNENMSAEKARANIDTLMKYIIPRMMISLELPITSATHEIEKNKSSLLLSPNPMSDYLLIETEKNSINSIQIFDGRGKLAFHQEEINASQYIFDRLELRAGIYFLKVQVGELMFWERVVFL